MCIKFIVYFVIPDVRVLRVYVCIMCAVEELETGSVEVETSGMSDARTLERLQERAYARDWKRCGLAAPPFRLSHANAIYTVCRRYIAHYNFIACDCIFHNLILYTVPEIKLHIVCNLIY